MPGTPSIVAISGKSGCGNTTVSRLVAEKLSYRLVNYTFHTMADELGLPFETLLKLSEGDSSYDFDVDKKQVELAHSGDCVIGSRLAIWLLPDARLKVYLYASTAVRARRISGREARDFDETLAFTHGRDLGDRERYRRLYDIDNDDFLFADLVLNTERFSPEALAEIIVAALPLAKTI